MKNSLLLLPFILLLIGCKSNSDDKLIKKEINLDSISKIASQSYFKATGNEPSWGLKMREKDIVFTSLIPGKEKLILMVGEVTESDNTKIKEYKVSNKTLNGIISIQEINCTDDMSGVIFPYKVLVDLKYNSESTFIRLNGCGDHYQSF